MLHEMVSTLFTLDITLSQRCFNVASMSTKALTNAIWLVKSMNSRKD